MAMTDEQRATLYEKWKDSPGGTIRLAIERKHIQQGRSFSEEAMNDLYDQMVIFISARVMARWNQTGEPPTTLRVTLEVEAQ